VQKALNCAQKRLGFEPDFFDADSGFDENLCLTTVKSKKFGTSTLPVAPHCCFFPVDDGNCQLKCEVVGTN
jgi:hypothetical protein